MGLSCVKIDRRRAAFLVVICGVIAAGGALAMIYRPSIAPIAKPDARLFSVDVIQRGAALAAIGDCIVCHTTDAGAPYAGGRALSTPFETLYATNITPDEATGIGSWSREAFMRAMRDVVSRSGEHLYPALPYEHFTHVDGADGIHPPVGARGSYMPPFADSLADAAVAEVAAYLRARYSSRAAWPKLASAAATARRQVVTPEMSMTWNPSGTHLMSMDQPIQIRR